MFLVSLRFLCAAHALHCLAGCFSFRSPPPTIFFKFVYSENTKQCAWWVLYRPPTLPIEGHWHLTHFDSGLLISRTFLPCARSSCTLLCLYLAFCTQKMPWRAHSLADTVPTFSNILRFSSELSNKWGTGLPCLSPLWIYGTGQEHKASLLPCLFSCLSCICLQLLRHRLYFSFAQVLSFHTCTITSPFLRNADFPFFKRLPSPSTRSCGMCHLALLVP